MAHHSRLRVRLLSTAFIVFSLLLVVRLYVVQIINKDRFSDKADRQYVQVSSDNFSRGSIYFKNSDGSIVSGATLKTGYIIAINPTKLADPESVYQKLSALIPLDHDQFIKSATKKNDPYEEIAKHLDRGVSEAITNLHIIGVSSYQERWRYYPLGSLGAQTLGFVGYKGDELVGRYGLESFFNSTLERKNKNVYVNFFAEIFSNIKAATQNSAEGDIVLTIEPSVQGFLEKELKTISEAYSSALTGGIIINPKTGEITALGAYPSFDPNSYQTEKDQSVFVNPLVENFYEMGSIIKPLTMSAGLDQGTVRPESTYTDTGSLTLNGYTIYNFDKKGRGPKTSMQEVLNQSLNTGAAYVAEKMGKDAFSKYMFSFGLGEKTGIDLPHESSGSVANLNSPRDIEHATAAYGQGIAMTPIQTVRALSVLANGGTLITPHVVSEIRSTGSIPSITKPTEGKRVISQKTSEDISRMLVGVVDKALLSGTVKMEHYSIAAKTGTAQMAKESGRGYYEDRYLHSFFGYFPAYDPSFLVFLFTVNPKGVSYASHTLTMPFIDTAKYLINYYQIPPDR